MPVQKEDVEALMNDSEHVKKIEDLLDLVNSAENRQELRLKEDYYSRFHWFGNSVGRNDKSYFSYQEEAVYDFIFNLNKSGILSDQVGMGKTIEAGMIISELASRNELRSLLIIVPNEIMAQKWEYELEDKFGIKPYIRWNNGTQEVYPQVKALKNYDDFCRCIFDCIAEEKFVELYEHAFKHKYEGKNDDDTLSGVIARYVKEDIQAAVDMINSGLEINELDVQVQFDGNAFSIVGTKHARPYVYDAKGEIAKFLNGKQNQRLLANTLNSPYFNKTYERIIKQELNGLYTLVGDYFTKIPEEISAISENMTNRYPILVIPIAYSDHEGESVRLQEFLNRSLLPKVENYKHKYIVQDKEGKISEVFEDYRIIDFFVDVGYQTVIVDEVHDYIDVCAKMERMKFHKNNGYDLYPSGEYNRFELFDDYYFIKKSSLYKKLKNLADKANRKIFLTATPIKSDMVDFYLLTLLASNKDAEAYKKVRENLDNAYPLSEEREAEIAGLYDLFKACAQEVAAKHFSNYRSYYFAAETEADGSGIENGRFRYPYFNNSFLKENGHNPELIREYLLGQLSYMSMEEVVLELILAYIAECGEGTKSGAGVKTIVAELNDLLSDLDGNYLQTRVIFRALFNNNIKIRFEEDFTDKDGRAIKRIRELLEMEEGARLWHKTYRKYGIRHTRHQTYNLGNCAELEKLSKNRIERYKNLPIWPRRDGKVIFLMRDDIFFDCFLDVKRARADEAKTPIRMVDLPNYDTLSGDETEKEERFRNAMAIFDYINNSMSGGDAETHQPSSSKYESVDLDDAGMLDYKLALVNKLMLGRDRALGAVNKKVLLFAENGRETITEWFRYQKCKPLYKGEDLDENKLQEYKKKWQSYTVETLGEEWKVSEDAEDLSREDGNLLIIIDPKRYEKGVDLQKADTIINFDINYCPLKMEQRIGRIDRIRPNGQSQGIQIISFVPLNDMSGFVINFFANELKMFTQWMGETTGIVSVPEEENNAAKGQDVSFEGKVYNLETYYRDVYELCSKDVSEEKTEEKAKAFQKRFDTDLYKTSVDFRFLQRLRSSFDKAFRNSVSPQRAGYTVTGKGDTKYMRFNSALGVFMPCAATSCGNCPNKSVCQAKGKACRNNYAVFAQAVKDFFADGKKYYKDEHAAYQKMLGSTSIHNMGGGNEQENLSDWLSRRENAFKKAYDKVKDLLPQATDGPFTIPFETYEAIFAPMKTLYWDDIVNEYIQLILTQFYKQCDSVLKGANLFERFIKALSIADFMNNMEGTV